MKKKYIFIVFFLIILFVLFNYNHVIKDVFNMFFEKIYFKYDKLVISNSFNESYITTLEDKISEYEDISKLKDCINSIVIYRNPIYWYDELTINKGEVDGIKKGDIVINNEGLVGIISDVYKNTSIVTLITSAYENSKLTVGILSGEDIIYGIVSDYDKNKNELVISELTKDISVSKDMSVVTTNFTNTFKEGIIISKVKYLIDDSNGLSKKAITTPVVDYNNINYVCVVGKK